MKRKIILFTTTLVLALAVLQSPIIVQAVNDWIQNGDDIYYSGGKVGIGTSSPAQSLDIYGGNLKVRENNRGGRVLFESSERNTDALIRYYDGYSSAENEGLILESDNQLNIYTGGTHRFILNNSGNIGIGTTSPAYRLDVNGGNMRIRENNMGGRLLFESNEFGTDALIRYYDGYSGVASEGLILESDNQLNIYTNATHRLIVNNSGNVGIGTDAPSNKLDVNGTIRAIDSFSSGGENIIVGNDVFLTDLDQANTLGVYGKQDSTQSTIKLGSGGATIKGYSNGDVCIGICN